MRFTVKTSGRAALHGLHSCPLMSQPNSLSRSIDLPKPVLELAVHLEERGLHTFSHGAGLLADLRTQAGSSESDAPLEAHSLLCAGSTSDILRALPRAVVTAEEGARVTQATAFGPVDILRCGPEPIEKALLGFGLGPLGFAYRPANEAFVDPMNQRAAMAEGRLELMTADPNPFTVAPRRYWIAARLIAENGLEPTSECLEAAVKALPSVAGRLPQAAPARREITRILKAPSPGLGLAFLRKSGVGAQLFPGTKADNEGIIAGLPKIAALRWAAWLRGSATSRVLVRFRTPHRLARRIECIQDHHPIEKSVESSREHGVKRLIQRLQPDEIEALFAWRRLELTSANNPAEMADVESQLMSIATRISEIHKAAARAGQVRALALDGQAVMTALGAGPGRHVGQALTHLAHFVSDRPENNNAPVLEAELFDWARKNTNLLD
jgi:tRNA nucleotidyltransferase (CCA-adding enzyme)